MQLFKLLKPLILNHIPDKYYLSYIYYRTFNKRLNLKEPDTFNEKLQWLKLYDHNPIYPKWVDKYEAKFLAEAVMGKDHIISSLGVWNKVEEIEFDKLPNKFVLKTTNGGGSNGVVICEDIKTFNKVEAKNKLQKALDFNIYKYYREWPYSRFTPRIIAEEYMSDNSIINQGGLSDYKFYCFNGHVECCMVCTNRGAGDTHFYFFNKEWELMRINKRGQSAPKGFSLPKPSCINDMFEIASVISKGFPFVRTDLYIVNNHYYFGELTFYPDSGLDKNYLPETDKWLGSLINLDMICHEESFNC